MTRNELMTKWAEAKKAGNEEEATRLRKQAVEMVTKPEPTLSSLLLAMPTK